jgi:eukaryotic-like serine/threonine-protein kinase
MMPWAAGAQFGPYVLISPLGAGRMGEAWKARDERLDRIVAIKRLTNHDVRASNRKPVLSPR